ncbi:MAG: recombinase family protein [Actinobacteria bacterium]|nr:recombinase family protein [Actinomycetota bacterium]
MVQKAKQGGCATKAPVGYLNVRDKIGGSEVSRVVLDPERAVVVREGFRMYATGDYSIAELQSWLATKGLTSPYAKKSGAPPPVSAIHRMLANPFYVGVVEWHGVQYGGQHKPLISRALFERVQEMLRPTIVSVSGSDATTTISRGSYAAGSVAIACP